MTKSDDNRLDETRDAAPIIQIAAMLIGAVFLLLGIAGFIPGITADFDRLDWAGRQSSALLLGIFAVSVLHNLVHVAFGIAGLILARTARSAKAYLIWGGAVCAGIWLYGLAIDHRSVLNFVPVNTAANWLHLGLAFAMITTVMLLGPYVVPPRRSPA
jgi:hypothetical protein